jgi:hypothetical protein
MFRTASHPVCSRRIHLVLLVSLPTSLAPQAAVPDQSLTSEQYVAKGAPAIDRPWSGKDYAAANDVLKKLADVEPTALPRVRSARSESYFGRIVSPENIAPLTNPKLPVGARLALGMELFEGPKQLAVVYLDASKSGATYDQELAELLGYQLQLTGPVLDLVEQFVGQLEPDDPKLRARLDSLMQLRSGLASVVDGCLIATSQSPTYGIGPRRRLVESLAKTLPRIAVELPKSTRGELPARLARMADEETDASLKRALNRLAAQTQSLGPSRIDAAVAALLAKTKSLPPSTAPAPPRLVWSWHTSIAGGFRAEFPGTPDEQTRTGTATNGTPIKAVILALKAGDGSIYTLLRLDGDAQLPDLDSIDRVLAAMFPKARVLDKREFDAPVGRRGRQMLLRSDRGVTAIRMAYMKGAIYQAIVESPAQNDDKISDAAKRFLESFEITTK